MNPLFLNVFGSVIAREIERESFNMHKPVRTATSCTLYPKNSFIQIACYYRSSLDGRGIFHSRRSLQVEFILLNISHTTFWHCHERSYPSFGQPFPKQLYNYSILCHTLQYHTIIIKPCHIIPFHVISYHAMSCQRQCLPYHAMLYSYHAVPCVMPCYPVLCHVYALSCPCYAISALFVRILLLSYCSKL